MQLQEEMTSFILFILVSTTLLAHSKSDNGAVNLVVLTTDEVKSQLIEALAEVLPELCRSHNVTVTQKPSVSSNDAVLSAIHELTDYVKDGVRSSITESLTPLLSNLSHLVTPGLTSSHPATSCMEILQLDPQSPSGLYWIRASEHEVKQMYCDMERSCKGVGGGWMRVASINMTDTGHQCPSGQCPSIHLADCVL